MTDAEVLNRLQSINDKLSKLHPNDSIGKVSAMSANLLAMLPQNEADSEKVSIARLSLENELQRVRQKSESSIRDMAYNIAHAIQFTSKFIEDREKRRNNPVIKIVLDQASNAGEYDLFEVSDSEESVSSVNFESKNSAEDRAKPHKCEVCDKRFARVFVLKEHRQTHLPDADKTFVCDTCGMRYANASRLEMHKRSHLDDADPVQAVLKRPHVCDICGKRYAYVGNLNDHKKKHSDDDAVRLPFACEVCGLRFRRSANLDDHQITHLSDDDPRKAKFQCVVCGKRLSNKIAFDHHQKTHLNDNDPEEFKKKRPFNCDKCEKCFATAYTLKFHKNTHIDDLDEELAEVKRPYPCDICEKRFAQLSTMKAHKKRIWLLRKKSFNCGVCSGTFSSKYKLRTHNLTHGISDPYFDKFRCGTCNKVLPHKNAFEQHKQMHLDDTDPDQAAQKRAFKCDECGKALRTAKNLKLHMARHTGNFPYKCEDCPRGFTQKNKYSAHVKTHKKGSDRVTKKSYKNDPDCSSSSEELEEASNSESDE